MAQTSIYDEDDDNYNDSIDFFSAFMSLAEAHEWDKFLHKSQQVKQECSSNADSSTPAASLLLQEAYTILHWMSKQVPDDILEKFVDLFADDLRDTITQPLHEAIEAGVSARFLRKLVIVFGSKVGSYDSENQTPLDILCRKIIMSEERQKYATSGNDEQYQTFDQSMDDNLWECARIMLVALSSSIKTGEKSMSEDNTPLLHAIVLAGSKCPESLRNRAFKKFKSQLTLHDKNGNLPIHVCAGMTMKRTANTDSKRDASSDDDDNENYFQELIRHAPQTVSMTNAKNQTPLEVAVESGRTWSAGIDTLVQAQPLVIERLDLHLAVYPQIMAKCGSDLLFRVLLEKPELYTIY